MYQISNYCKSKAGKGINVKLSSYNEDAQAWDKDIYIYIPFVESLTEEQARNPKTVVAAPTKSGDMCIKIPKARLYAPAPKPNVPERAEQNKKTENPNAMENPFCDLSKNPYL